MFSVSKTVTLFLDVLFPSEPNTRQFDHIQSNILARTAVRTSVRTTPPCLAPLPYDNKLVRSAIHAIKYHGHKRAAQLLGEVLMPFVSEELADKRMLGSYHTAVVIPIPLHKKRLRERGFNQAERLAQVLVSELNEPKITLETATLIRSQDTISQTKQRNRSARLHNMEHAFSVTNKTAIAGEDIVLVDDVTTTGATMKAAHTALLNAGAREVLCVAAAH